MSTTHEMEPDYLYNQVQEHYGSVARGEKPAHSGLIAQAFGYTAEELNSIPHDANLGLSCGNPLAIASIREVGLKDVCPLLLYRADMRAICRGRPSST
jgi:hypothetical protein